jgi:hypothetical protein
VPGEKVTERALKEMRAKIKEMERRLLASGISRRAIQAAKLDGSLEALHELLRDLITREV